MNYTLSPNTLRPAFTIIEILVSVIIISFSIIYVLQIHTSNHEQIVYITERNKRSLEDSLYLTTKILEHHKDTKNAYDILERQFKIKEDETREILKKNERSVYIPEEILIIPPPETPGPTAVVNEVKLKGNHSSVYWHFKITSFNNKAEALTGFSTTEAMGKLCSEILNNKKRGSECLLKQIRGFGEAKTGIEAEFVNRYGEYIPVRINAAPIEDDNGKHIGYMLKSRNTRRIEYVCKK